MNNISCDVCLDLIPLVKDGAASKDSITLVEDHIKSCEKCKSCYTCQPEYTINDKKNIKSIKKTIYFFSIVILIAGCLLGSALSNSINVFYNFMIMPSLGVLSYIILNKKSFIFPPCIFFLSYIWNMAESIISYKDFNLSYLTSPLFYSIIYLVLSALGIIIAMLLKFAFRKEPKL